MTQQAWSERLAQAVARELRRHREQQGLSAQDLSDGCARLGMPIQRSVIANFENGRRASVSVAELLVFAAVLRIPPVWLISPMGFEPLMEILPGEEGDPYACATWISGSNAREDGEEDFYCDNPSVLAGDLVFLLEQIEDCRSKVEQIEGLAADGAPALARLDERLQQLRAGYDGDVATQKEILDRIKVMSPDERISSDTAEEFKKAETLFAAMKERSEELSNLSRERLELAQTESNLKLYQEWQDGYEKEARELIGEFRVKGWLPPKLPEHLTYLLEEPKKEKPSLPPGRRRKRSK